MLCTPTFKKLYQRVPQWVNVQPEDPLFFKLACHAIMRYNQVERKKNCPIMHAILIPALEFIATPVQLDDGIPTRRVGA